MLSLYMKNIVVMDPLGMNLSSTIFADNPCLSVAAFTTTEGTFVRKRSLPSLFSALGAPELEPPSELKQSVWDEPRATYISIHRTVVYFLSFAKHHLKTSFCSQDPLTSDTTIRQRSFSSKISSTMTYMLTKRACRSYIEALTQCTKK